MLEGLKAGLGLKVNFSTGPAELSPGEFSHLVFNAVMQQKARVVMIDSLNGYRHSMPEEKFLSAQLHEMFTYRS